MAERESPYLWSTTALSNGNADTGINFLEGQLPSTVNNSNRGMMAAQARWLKDNNGSLTTTGSANAYLLTINETWTAYATGKTISFKANFSNTGAATINVTNVDAVALGAKALRVLSVAGDSALVANQIINNGHYRAVYDAAANAAAGAWVIINPAFHAVAGATITPPSNDGAALGTTALQWSDLFLAEGGVINWDNGDVTITQTGNVLSFAGATTRYEYDAALTPTANDGAALGTTALSWSDVFLASGAVLNFNNGNYTVTHSAGVLTTSGALVVASNAVHALSVGPNGDTNPALVVVGNVASQATGVAVQSAAAGGGAGVSAISSGTNELLAINAKGNESLYLQNSATGAVRIGNALLPITDDGAALGNAASNRWSDAFFASGAVLNFNNGDILLTHSADLLALTGGDFTWTGAALASYTPTVTASSGTFTSVSATGAWKQFGKIVIARVAITVTTLGTAAVQLKFTLPTNSVATAHPIHGINSSLNKACIGYVNNTSGADAALYLYDGTFPATGNGQFILLTLVYEAV